MAPKATTATAPAETEKVRAPRVSLDDVKIGGIAAETSENPFARGNREIPEDHPLVQAFRQSYDAQAAVRVGTETPNAVTKILRRIAAQEGKGVRIKEHDDAVTFQATDRKKVVRKPKTPV